MLSNRHAMINVKALGSTPGSSILSIAVVNFQPDCIVSGMDLWRRSIHSLQVNTSLESCLAAGLLISADALKWWMFQSDEARQSAFGQSRIEVPILEGCRRAASFLERLGQDCRIWSSDATSNISILEAAMRTVGIKPPWSSEQVRDTTTILEVANIEDSWRHNEPVTDAWTQAAKLSAALVALTDRAIPLAAIAVQDTKENT